MSTHDQPIYGVETPRSAPIPPGSGPQVPPQMAYYSPREPQAAGCGTLLFRAVMIMGVFAVCCFLALLFLSVLAVSFSTTLETAIQTKDAGVTEQYVSGNRTAEQKVAILSIEGLITGSDDGFVAKQIRQISKDNSIKAIVLRVDSPGGTMSGSDYYYYKLQKMKEQRDIPIVVSMGSTAASGGYYVSMVGDEIFAEHSTITGSIGVIVPLYKAVELSKKIGVESTPITSGPLKAMGSMFHTMDDKEKAVWQQLVDDSFGRFKEIILKNRKNLTKEELDKLATGQIYTASEAEKNKLIDKIGFVDDAVEEAMNKAGLSENNAKVIKFKPQKGLTDVLMMTKSPEVPFSSKSLLDVTTPKVYLISPYILPIQE